MAKLFDEKEILELAIDAVKTHRLIWVNEVVTYLPVAQSTFYEYFPADSEGMEAIKRELNDSRVKSKAGLRKKWHVSDNATLQIALYKLIGDDEEVHRLNGSKQEHKHSVGESVESFLDQFKNRDVE